MSKITLDDLTTAYSSRDKLNENFQAIEDELNDKVLYRDNPAGEDNSMQSNLDMNSKRVLNLPSPVNDNEPARWVDVKDGVTGIEEPVPSQSGNAGEALTTNGSSLVFGKIHELLDTADDIATTSINSSVNQIHTSGPTAGLHAPAIYVPYKISGVRQTGTAGQHPTWGYGVMYDADGNGWILSGYLTFKQFGLEVDGTTDDGAAFAEMNAFCNAFDVMATGESGTSSFTSTLTVTSRLNHEKFVYSFTGLGGSDNGIEFAPSNSTKDAAGLLGVMDINMNSGGQDGLVIQEGESCSFGSIRILNPGRASLHFEPSANYNWIETLVFHKLRTFGGQNMIRVTVPNLTDIFINKITFYDFEGRTCTDYPIYVDLQGSTSAQKASEWTFINAEIDGKTSTQSNVVYVNRSGSAGTCDGWTFITPTFEDTSGTSHGNALDAASTGLFTASVYDGTLFTYTATTASNAATNWFNTGRINTNADGDYHNRLRKTSFERIHTGTDDSAQFFGTSEFENLQKLVTTDIAGGNSSRSNGATFSFSVAHNTFGRYQITLIDDTANADATGVIEVLIYSNSQAVAQKAFGCTGITITSISYDSGDDEWDLTLTNNTGATINYRAFITKIR